MRLPKTTVSGWKMLAMVLNHYDCWHAAMFSMCVPFGQMCTILLIKFCSKRVWIHGLLTYLDDVQYVNGLLKHPNLQRRSDLGPHEYKIKIAAMSMKLTIFFPRCFSCCCVYNTIQSLSMNYLLSCRVCFTFLVVVYHDPFLGMYIR